MHLKNQNPKKNILIIGAGFCGLQVAKKLAKKLPLSSAYQIVVIDRSENHIYNSDLYEISTAYSKKITAACLRALEETVCIPIKKVLGRQGITFLKDEVVHIDYDHKKVAFKNAPELHFEYLVVALGSVTNYYNIKGLEEHGLALKTLEDALRINCHVDQFFRERYEKKDHNKVHIVVGGGGFTGVEYACELIGFLKKLSQKYTFQREEVSISVIQGSSELVGLGAKVSELTEKRFQQLGIKAFKNTRITAYDGKQITVLNKEDQQPQHLPADILIWTGGIKPNPLLKHFPILDTSGALEVYPTLESPHYPKVYAGGDNAAIFDPKHHQLIPKLAQLAVKQGTLIAHNIYCAINQKEQKVYTPFFKGFILPLGGKYFLYHRNNITFTGIIPYIMKKFVDLMYFMSLLPTMVAFKKWRRTENIFIQND